jgi:hypothetical protein
MEQYLGWNLVTPWFMNMRLGGHVGVACLHIVAHPLETQTTIRCCSEVYALRDCRVCAAMFTDAEAFIFGRWQGKMYILL